jgi:Xaa-Pro aminopeptidase
LIDAMTARGIDGVVLLHAVNQYYMSSFPVHHSIPDQCGLLPVVYSRHAPDHPILLMPEIDLAWPRMQPTWIVDRRPYATQFLHPMRPSTTDDLQPFMEPEDFETALWRRPGGKGLQASMGDGVRAAMCELGLDRGVVAFDNFGAGCAIASALPEVKPVWGDPLLLYARAGKTPAELDLLRRATQINQKAMQRTIAAWELGMSWRDMNLAYQVNALGLGGQPNLPDTMGLGYSTGRVLSSDLECNDEIIQTGSTVMFDAHGKHNGYCWDGGKSWVVGGAASASARRNWNAMYAAAHEIEQFAKPGMPVGDLVDLGLDTIRRCGVSNDGVLIFFHGLGLDHMDRDITSGQKNWRLDQDMLIATHIYYPGDVNERLFLEEIVLVNGRGNERFFTWDESLLGV